MDVPNVYRSRSIPIVAIQRPPAEDEEATEVFIKRVLDAMDNLTVMKPMGGTTALLVVHVNWDKLRREYRILFEVEPTDWVFFKTSEDGRQDLGRMHDEEFQYYFKKVSEADMADARRLSLSEIPMV